MLYGNFESFCSIIDSFLRRINISNVVFAQTPRTTVFANVPFPLVALVLARKRKFKNVVIDSFTQ